MEVCRLPPVVSPEEISRQSAESVAALHKSMVTLRGELIRKNEKIRSLEESLRKQREEENEQEEGRRRTREESQHQQENSSSFEDMFVLQVGKEDVDQILLYEESLAREEEEQQRRKQQEKEKKDAEMHIVSQDPVEAFDMAEEEGEEEGDEKEEKNSTGTSILLVPNQDIVFHAPPPSALRRHLSASSVERPILREASPEWSRSSAGSQTDISALVATGWKSEPALTKESPLSMRTAKTGEVAAQKSPSIQEKKKMTRVASSVVASCGTKREVEKKLLARERLEQKARTKRPVMEPPSTDVDELLEEAKNYLQVAREKLVTSKDWESIRRKKRK